MGTNISRLAVVDRFHELSLREDIPSDDDVWEAMLSAASNNLELNDGEFFGLVSTEEVRRIWDNHPNNLKMLFQKAVEKIEGLIRTKAIGSHGTVSSQISNCCRIVTRLAPIVYEANAGPQFASQINHLIPLLRTLLHFRGYTISLTPRQSPIWKEGIGCRVADVHSGDYDEQREVVLRALLSVLSSPLYTCSYEALENFTTTTKDPLVMCSLLNSSLDSGDAQLHKLSITLLTISLTHMAQQKNQFRRFFAKLQNQNDYDWISARLKARLDRSLYVGDSGAMYITLLWELIQANATFAATASSLPSIAERIMREVSQPVGELKELENNVRLRVFTLLTLTAQSDFCAQAVALQVFNYVVGHRKDLKAPSVELATMVDVLWNTVPHLVLTENEVAQFIELREEASSLNPTVSTVLESMHEVMLHRNPLLAKEGEEGNTTSTSKAVNWTPIRFQWDVTRFRWYQGILWGHAFKLEPKIWSTTKIQLFRISKWDFSTALMMVANSLIAK